MIRLSRKFLPLGFVILAMVGIIINAQSHSTFPQPPDFSTPPGTYRSPLKLTLSSEGYSAQIRYTLDGSEPGPMSSVYTQPLLLNKTTVVKAISLNSQGEVSASKTGTFLVDEEIADGFVVISLSMDSVELFDTLTGHYTIGKKQDWLEGKAIPNYWKRVEFPMHFEFFDLKGKRVVDQAIGAKIFGNFSRSLPQKSFRVNARKKYGKKRLKYNFFPDLEISRFKNLVIRNAGTDWNYLHFRDTFIQNWVAGKTFLDTQAGRPCVMFLNGKYWGVYHLREYVNKHMLANHYDLNPDSIDLLEASDQVKDGSNEDFMELCHFIDNHDLSLPANYAYVESELDIKNLTDYWVVELWAANWDWMDANVRFWRDASTDSKWRYILWDLDRTMGPMEQNGQNPLQHHAGKDYVTHVRILRALVNNEQFRLYFINRYADLLNTLFVPEPLLADLDAKVNMMAPEMTRHFEIWNKNSLNYRWGKETRGYYEDWAIGQVSYVRDFISRRPETARNDLVEVMELDGQFSLKLNVSPDGTGNIQLNTIKITTFPWEGTYFGGIPITLTALPVPGYQFSNWYNEKGEVVGDGSPSLKTTPDSLGSISAIFIRQDGISQGD